MIDLKGLRRAVEEIAKEKKLPVEKVMEVIESSIAAAYKREYREKGEIIKAEWNEILMCKNFTICLVGYISACFAKKYRRLLQIIK